MVPGGKIMGRWVKRGIKMAMSALMCSCMAAGAVSAAPMDELEEVLEQMGQEMKEQAVLSSYLGLDELGDAIKDHGLRFDFQTGISEETGEQLGLPEEIVDGSYYRIQMQIDPEKRQWFYDQGLSLMGLDFLGLELYGDSDMLTFSLPRLYDRALGIRGGNLYEQIEGSWADQEEGEIPEVFREIELDFFPDDGTLKRWKEFAGRNFSFEEIGDHYDAMLDSFKQSLEVTKEDENDEIVYTVTMEWEDLKALYQEWTSIWVDAMKQAGAYGEIEYTDFEEQIDEMFRQVQLVIRDDPVIEFRVSDGRLARVSCELYADTTVLEKETENEDGQIYDQNDTGENETESGIESGKLVPVKVVAADRAAELVFAENYEIPKDTEPEEEQTDVDMMEDFKNGYLEYEIIFWEETAGIQDTDINFYVKNEEREIQYAAYLKKSHMTEKTKVIDYLDVMLMEGMQATYYGTLFYSVFDTVEDSLDVRFSLTDQDTEDTVYLELYGTFTDVVPGQGFTLNFDKCAIGQNYEELGALSGKISIEAQPGEITKPQDVQMIFDMTQEEINMVMEKIEENMNQLSGMFGTEETEYETEIE